MVQRSDMINRIRGVEDSRVPAIVIGGPSAVAENQRPETDRGKGTEAQSEILTTKSTKNTKAEGVRRNIGHRGTKFKTGSQSPEA